MVAEKFSGKERRREEEICRREVMRFGVLYREAFWRSDPSSSKQSSIRPGVYDSVRIL